MNGIITRITNGASIMPVPTTTASGFCTCDPIPADSAAGNKPTPVGSFGITQRGKVNRDGIGARVTVIVDKGTVRRATVKTGSSYLSQSELPLTFGLDTKRPATVQHSRIPRAMVCKSAPRANPAASAASVL